MAKLERRVVLTRSSSKAILKDVFGFDDEAPSRGTDNVGKQEDVSTRCVLVRWNVEPKYFFLKFYSSPNKIHSRLIDWTIIPLR